jgi:hypothetical protein
MKEPRPTLAWLFSVFSLSQAFIYAPPKWNRAPNLKTRPGAALAQSTSFWLDVKSAARGTA